MVLSEVERTERRAASKKKWYQKNKERLLKKQNEYNKVYNLTPAGIKATTIANWKRKGLIHPEYDQLYELYINCNCCDICKKEFKNTFDRCMDHHHPTGLFRQFLCRDCNNHDNWKTKVPPLCGGITDYFT